MAKVVPVFPRRPDLRKYPPRLTFAVWAGCIVLTASVSADPQASGSSPVVSGALQNANTAYLHVSFEHAAMATKFEIDMYVRDGEFTPADLRRIAEEAFAAVDDLESRMSSWNPASQVSAINRAAGLQPVKVSTDIFDAVRMAKKYSGETGGAFDITIGPLLALWRMYDGRGNAPPIEEVAAAMSRVGMDKIRLDAQSQTIELGRRGMRLDFGGIGKGIALDKVAETLRRYGIDSARLHAGTSTIVAIGAPPGADGWTVRVRDPYNDDGWLDSLSIRDASFSTSGCYGKQPEAGGKSNCHIIDPRTGFPVDGVLSVSVIAKTGAAGDALSTALLAMDAGERAAFCASHPDIGVVYVAVPALGNPRPVRFNL